MSTFDFEHSVLAGNNRLPAECHRNGDQRIRVQWNQVSRRAGYQLGNNKSRGVYGALKSGRVENGDISVILYT